VANPSAPLTIPDFSLVLLMGPSGAGKSTFAARHFLPTEVLSSDRCRAWVADDEADQGASADAFDVLHYIAAKRLAARRLTVIDATHLRREDRHAAVALARRYHALPVVIAFDLPEAICQERNRQRSGQRPSERVIRQQVRLMHQALRGLKQEGIRQLIRLSSEEAATAAELVRVPLYNDRRGESGPFDIIGDPHGCLAELEGLLDLLGYRPDAQGVPHHPAGRRVIFLGDLVDRGPHIPQLLQRVMAMVAAGSALCLPGNHEAKLLRWLRGKQVQISHGLADTIAQIEALPEAQRRPFLAQLEPFLDSLVSHYWLDGGRLVVAHAGLKQEMQGRGSGAVREFCLYGETNGEIDAYGLPVRLDWAAEYRGEAKVIYGHTPVPHLEWINNTLCIDTGCVFGGALTALRYPELEPVSVPALRTYVEPTRPLATPGSTGHYGCGELMELAAIAGKQHLITRYQPHVNLQEGQTAAAIEALGRFCIDPRWLIYLPPTMSPAETSQREGLLEHPEEAFAYYRRAGVERVVLEEKHMGSRAVVVLCRSAAAAQRRFKVEDGACGVIYTRTGRPFFSDPQLSTALLQRLAEALTASGLWERLASDWICLDCELLPWSVKAQALIREQYAPVGLAAHLGLAEATALLTTAQQRGLDSGALLAHYSARQATVERYNRAYRHYLWPVNGVDDLQLAPFHLLASEGAVHVDKPHAWHMTTLAELGRADPLLRATAWREVALDDADQLAAAIAWWEELTAAGGEGVVVKPAAFVAYGRKGILQPAIKCRGREYLRIIYGPEYTLPGQLERLRSRGLGAKRRLAINEFSLGLEALHRFVAGEPLHRVHPYVAGVLALESEAVDPRL